MLKLSKTTYTQKLFPSELITLYATPRAHWNIEHFGPDRKAKLAWVESSSNTRKTGLFPFKTHTMFFFKSPRMYFLL